MKQQQQLATAADDADIIDIDVLFYGTVTKYRRDIIDALRARGIKVLVITDSTWGLYHEGLNDLIRRSKIVLVLNTFGGKAEWKITRFARILANSRFILAERNYVEEEEPFNQTAERGLGGGPGIVFMSADEITGGGLEAWLLNAEGRRRVAAEGKRIFSEVLESMVDTLSRIEV